MDTKLINAQTAKIFHDAGYRGKNIVFALIDSGVTPVGYLSGRVIAGNIHGCNDMNGHGTFIASQLIQACPDATVLSWNCLPDGGGSIKNVIAALVDVLRYVKANPKNQYIVNMSFTGGCDEDVKGSFQKAIDDLVNADVPVFVAAGNDGQEVLNKYPSCFESPICISALNQDGSKAPYSTWHNEVDFADWGTGCTGLTPLGFHTVMNGTSMACPNAAAKAGLLCDWYKQVYGYWPREPELYDMLKAMAQDMGETGKDPYFGYGFIIPAMVTEPKEETKEKKPMFEYVTDLKLVWPKGRTARKSTDHIQIHHTVGDYSTPEKCRALHQRRIDADGYKGIEYSFGVCPDGSIYEGRGLEYCHGAVKNSLTKVDGVGACDRSVSVTLIGDMRKDGYPTAAQYAAAQKLVKDLMTFYDLPASAVLGHNEIPVSTGGTYPTLCPCIDMDKFRADLRGETQENIALPAEPAKTDYPVMVKYGGSTYINVRQEPETGRVIGKFSKGEKAVLLQEDGEWDEIVLIDQTPIIRGWCKGTYNVEV